MRGGFLSLSYTLVGLVSALVWVNMPVVIFLTIDDYDKKNTIKQPYCSVGISGIC